MKILEIGPSYSPVLRRSDGWNLFTLDHLSAGELREKYSAHPEVDVASIEEVDFIWRSGPLNEAVDNEHVGTFDGIIASHMIEHFPDLIEFFQSADRLLKDDGKLSLVVPDKRFCFDFFQPLQLTGDVLEAHAEGRVRHSKSSVFNSIAYMVKAADQIAWTQQPTQLLKYYNGNLTVARDEFGRHKTSAVDPYVDVHGWYFTPSSFRLICLELACMEVIPLLELAFFPTEGCEFFVTLQKGGGSSTDWDGINQKRMDYLTNILLEIREQTDFLIEGPNFLGR